jgi:hypothetical protein
LAFRSASSASFCRRAMGYDVKNRKLVVNDAEAATVRMIVAL